MARSMAKITVDVWADPDWCALPATAQRLYLLLLSQRRLTLVGLLDYRPKAWARLAADTTPEQIDHDLGLLEQARFVLVDHDTDEVLIRTFVRHDLPAGRANRNLIKGVWSAWLAVESPQLRAVAVENLPEYVWSTESCPPPPAATAAHAPKSRSAPIQTAVGTAVPTGVVTGSCDWSTEPPVTSHLSPATPHLPPAAAARPDVGGPLDPVSDEGELRTDAGAARGTPTRALTPADRLALITEACDVLAVRHVAANPSKYPQRHRRAVRQGKLDDYRVTGHALLVADPSLTAVDLADRLEPPVVSAHVPAPFVPEQVEVDPEVNLGGVAAAKARANRAGA